MTNMIISVIIFHPYEIITMEFGYIQMQAWQEELERARQGQREAENKLSSLEARFFYHYFLEKFI